MRPSWTETRSQELTAMYVSVVCGVLWAAARVAYARTARHGRGQQREWEVADGARPASGWQVAVAYPLHRELGAGLSVLQRGEECHDRAAACRAHGRRGHRDQTIGRPGYPVRRPSWELVGGVLENCRLVPNRSGYCGAR